MMGGRVICQRPEGRSIKGKDLMDGNDNIPRNLDGLYVEAKSVSVFANELVGFIVVVLVTACDNLRPIDF
jgi:hypothetical protein